MELELYSGVDLREVHEFAGVAVGAGLGLGLEGETGRV